MKCQEEGGCDKEAVGTDIENNHLCREHLNFSLYVQKQCQDQLDKDGYSFLVPDKYRLERNN